MTDLLIINRYTCPRLNTETIQAHLLNINDMTIQKSFPKMSADNDYLDLFISYKNVILVDVPKSAMLDSINIIRNNWNE